ncbi:hypothetical protein [Sulfuritalea sp.]|uniref:hypothetical protein n=1 Tax=Sulfuritalea sp. TaxID=2480090 RepID=UPI00286E1703|nr:hypothetical protein [Sulfuritalea sp.]
MTKEHTTKHKHGDGTRTETKTTTYDSGGSKSVTKDITNRTLLNDGKVISRTDIDKNGNSRTKKY